MSQADESLSTSYQSNEDTVGDSASPGTPSSTSSETWELPAAEAPFTSLCNDNGPMVTRTLTMPSYNESDLQRKIATLLVGGLEYPLMRVDPRRVDHPNNGQVPNKMTVYTTSQEALLSSRDAMFVSTGYFGPPADAGRWDVLAESRVGYEPDAMEALVLLFPRIKLAIPNDQLHLFGLDKASSNQSVSIQCPSLASKDDEVDETEEYRERPWIVEQVGEGMYARALNEYEVRRPQTLIVDGSEFDLYESVDPKNISWTMELRAVERGAPPLAMPHGSEGMESGGDAITEEKSEDEPDVEST